MTVNELALEMMKHADELAIETYEDVVVGVKQARMHKKPRINKKWRKRYGLIPDIKRKKCKRIDVTLQTMIDFCKKYNFPIPDEFLIEMRAANDNENNND